MDSEPQVIYDQMTDIQRKAEDQVVPEKNKIRGSGKIVYLRDLQIEGWAKSRQILRTQYTQTPVHDRDRRQALQKKAKSPYDAYQKTTETNATDKT